MGKICITYSGNVYILIGKPESNRTFVRHRQKWEDSIKTNLREVGFEDVDWREFGPGSLSAYVNRVLNFRVL